MASYIQQYKTLIRSAIPVSSDALLVLLGLSIYLVTCLVFRLPFSSSLALLPPLLVSILLEGWEIVDYYGFEGVAASSSSKIMVIVLRHSKDVLVFNLAPVLVCLAAFWAGKT